MKKLLLYTVLFSYTVVMLKPAFPYVKDAVNHILFYKQHMATVHFENGKYHVHKEVAKNSKEDNSNKNAPISKKENTSTDHIIFLNKVNKLFTNQLCKQYLFFDETNFPSKNLKLNYPPPRI